MVKTVQELALVLRSQIFSDNDLILTLLSQHSGKLSAIYKKGRGKAAYQPEILDLAHFELKPGSSANALMGIRSFKPEKSFAGLRNKLHSFMTACAWIEAVDCLTVEAHHESSELFELCRETLSRLNTSEDARQSLRILYEAICLAIQQLGYGNEKTDHPSLNNLKAVAHQIESLSHRQLKSFDSVYALATKLTTENKQ